MGKTIEQFEKVRKINGLTQKEFAEQLDVSRSFYSQIKMGLKEPSKSMYINISKVYGVNIDWLEDESKEMYYKEPEVKKMHNIKMMRAPLVPIKVQAGYLITEEANARKKDLDMAFTPDPGLPKSMEKVWFEVSGDSMIDEIKPRDYVMGMKYPTDSDIRKYVNEDFIVITKEHEFLVKRLTEFDSKTNTGTFSSLNPAYKPIVLDLLKDVHELWRVVIVYSVRF